MMIGCKYGHEQCVWALIEANADVDRKNKGGSTALIIACKHGHVECVQALLEANANVNVQNKKGVTALAIATSLAFAS